MERSECCLSHGSGRICQPDSERDTTTKERCLHAKLRSETVVKLRIPCADCRESRSSLSRVRVGFYSVPRRALAGASEATQKRCVCQRQC
eukprot:1857692-Rhodomonas_salina.1